ncbi:peptide/nickel transport system ATP-binding protein [Klenkia marina]|uniref:Peptide/nickel transport system ATP-binding protein n=1 Tax=Klenkia marina TaxID=1960309 RepID=A0A1G4XQ73_9ACTN|nr:ATP-binding cassette domain-containing protein [Klenkia marina]SCX43383.1 peptide/nickel transport system ATP-binding protein [Klenkia marina]
MSAVLAATGLERTYAGTRPHPWARRERHRALRGVDLQLAPGERLALVGSSGSGKSTLLRCLLALDTPDAGTVHCDGRPVRHGRPAGLRWFRRRVQYVPQDPASTLDPRMTVGALVAEPLRALAVPGDHRAAVATALQRVRLDPGLTDRRPGELSGGQAQRVALARALAPAPEVLLADEPVSGLDLAVRRQVVELLGELSADGGLALLLVSHDLSVVARLCPRTVVLDDGAVVEDRATDALLADPHHPATRALVAAVPRLPA